MEVATEQYGFCPDIVDQEQDDPTVGNLADVLLAVHRLVFLVGLMGGATNDRISENLYRTKKTVCCDQ